MWERHLSLHRQWLWLPQHQHIRNNLSKMTIAFLYESQMREGAQWAVAMDKYYRDRGA